MEKTTCPYSVKFYLLECILSVMLFFTCRLIVAYRVLNLRGKNRLCLDSYGASYCAIRSQCALTILTFNTSTMSLS